LIEILSMRSLKSCGIFSGIIITLISLSVDSFAQTDTAIAKTKIGPRIEFEEFIIDMGTVPYDKLTDSNVVFHFRNTGDEPLQLSWFPSSGFFDWVEPYYNHDSIMPGASGTIKLGSWAQRFGPFDKSFLVVSNASNGYITLRVKGNIIAPAKTILPEDTALKMPLFHGAKNEDQSYKMMNHFIDSCFNRNLIDTSVIGKTVYFEFTIDKNGKLLEPAILKQVSPAIDNEIIRILLLMPDWTPGTCVLPIDPQENQDYPQNLFRPTKCIMNSAFKIK